MSLSLFPLKLTKMPHVAPYGSDGHKYGWNRMGQKMKYGGRKTAYKNQAWKKNKVVRRPKGTVQSGLLQSRARYQNHSLLLGTIPKVGTKDLKYFDGFSSTASSTINELGVSQTVRSLQVISDDDVSNGIIQGNTVNTRIGQKIFLKKLILRGYVGYPYIDSLSVTAAPGGTMQGRLIVVLDRQPNQTVAGPSDLLAGADTENLSMRMINYSNTKRFKVLKDETFTIQPQRYAGTTLFGQSTHKIECELDLSGITVSYDATNQGLAGNIVTNNIYVFYGTDHFIPEDLDLSYTPLKSVNHLHSRLYFTG